MIKKIRFLFLFLFLTFNAQIVLSDENESGFNPNVLTNVYDIILTPSNTSMHISWSHAEENSLVYRVYNQTSLLSTSTSLFFEHTNLIPGTIYYYTIEVIRGNLKNESLEFSLKTLPSSQKIIVPISETQIPQGTLGIENKECQSLFTYTPWGVCKFGEQTRVRSDDNSCLEDYIQTRSCEVDSTSDDLIYLNAKKIPIEKIDENFYISSYPSGTEFFLEEQDLGISFIVYNKEEDLDYLARKIEYSNSIHYYSLEVIDQELLESGTLETEGLVQRSVLDVTQETFDGAISSSQFPVIIGVIIVFLFLILIFIIIFYIKKTKKKELLSHISNANTNVTDLTSSNFSHSEVNKYSGYITEINNYISKYPDVPKLELRKNLEKVGWNKELLDSVFNKKIKNS